MTAYHDENDCYTCRICGQWFDNPDDAKECCFDEKLEEIFPEEDKK
jgi:hypothetical protein